MATGGQPHPEEARSKEQVVRGDENVVPPTPVTHERIIKQILSTQLAAVSLSRQSVG